PSFIEKAPAAARRLEEGVATAAVPMVPWMRMLSDALFPDRASAQPMPDEPRILWLIVGKRPGKICRPGKPDRTAATRSLRAPGKFSLPVSLLVSPAVMACNSQRQGLVRTSWGARDAEDATDCRGGDPDARRPAGAGRRDLAHQGSRQYRGRAPEPAQDR